MRQDVPARLAIVVERVRMREGSVPPSPEGITRAAQELTAPPVRRGLSQRCGAAEIHYVEDGQRYMVAVYLHQDRILDAECSCQSREVCWHLLAVLASDGRRLDV